MDSRSGGYGHLPNLPPCQGTLACSSKLSALKELNLKLVKGPPSTPSPVPALASLAPAPAPAPSPGGSAALATGPPGSSTGSGSAPSGLMALLVGQYDTLAEGYESEEDSCWAGDKDGLTYDSPPASSGKCNNLVACYPSCNYTAAMPLFPSASSNGLPVPAALASCSIILPQRLQAIIAWMIKASISPGLGHHFSFADTGATDHMFPDKLAFISHKSIPNLQVWMGNNSSLPVLGHSTAIISINGQRHSHSQCITCVRSRGSTLQPLCTPQATWLWILGDL